MLSLVLGAFVALRQRDVKRMLAYSSINHAGFILLGVVAGTARGASASLYYLFVYMFMTIGSFAVVTVLGRSGDDDHDLSRYRGLAGRQPVLALAFAVLLLAQAGAPFTTGLWAKVQVVFAVVQAGDVPLGVIAMVTAVVAAYFYLRIAVLMYAGGGLGEPEAEAVTAPASGEGLAAPTTTTMTTSWGSPEAASTAVSTINGHILLADEEPEGEDELPEAVPVPVLTGLAIALCTGCDRALRLLAPAAHRLRQPGDPAVPAQIRATEAAGQGLDTLIRQLGWAPSTRLTTMTTTGSAPNASSSVMEGGSRYPNCLEKSALSQRSGDMRKTALSEMSSGVAARYRSPSSWPR